MFINIKEIIEETVTEIAALLPKPISASSSEILSTSKYLKD